MTDNERIIKGLECCAKWMGKDDIDACNSCPYHKNFNYDDHGCLVEVNNDAIFLLKEQEALPIVYETNKYTGLPVAHCPSCGEYLVQFHSGVDGKESKFCYYCGQEVQW